ncbi:DUF1634 domain-containing protein [Niabella drilacis]|uniref:Uncharacterized membrane protein n=1 Tax=Niabella drilacis (strain DSM 25811 / CCM 8410 / CCUG 62505 / LMG 26954 / E90) TaxID=1285928 RepID=A0A1G7BMX8_NIADE|nr:DUF1634 domain-containing protein [Niabella drilacis]SDE28307.1 Uncharacterized membrane protein [Niabella drilacis]
MQKNNFTDKTLQTIIGTLLRYGVWLALGTGAAGGVVYLLKHGGEPMHYASFTEADKSIGQLLKEMVTGIKSHSGTSIIFLGIILLFLTPALRLLFSFIAFLVEKDYLYVLITFIVMMIIGISISLGYSH